MKRNELKYESRVVARNRIKSNRSFTINNPVVLITADGRTLGDDLVRFLSWEIPHDVYCVARSYKLYPGKMDHWANVDANTSIWWAENLPPKKIKPETLRHTLGYVRGFDVDWDVIGNVYEKDEILWHGSTSLFAVYTAIVMGYGKVVLAGSPLDCKGHWYDPPEIMGPRWSCETYQAWLDFARCPDAEKVRAMSGYTAQILGEPREEWLNG
jgi:hypothetical protein